MERKFIVPPKFEDSKREDFKYIYATGVFGGLDPNDGRLIFYLDRLEPETVNEPPGAQKIRKITRELQVEVHVSPSQFKNIWKWMGSHIQRYEEVFGEIPLEPKTKGKSKDTSGKMIS